MGLAAVLNVLETRKSLAPTDRDSNTGSSNPYPSHQADYAVLAVARVWIEHYAVLAIARVWIQHYAPTTFLIKQVIVLKRLLRWGTLCLC